MNKSWNSWKTSLCAGIALFGGALTLAPVPEWAHQCGFAIQMMATALGLAFARDNNVTSEDAGAKTALPVPVVVVDAPPVAVDAKRPE